MVLKREFGIAVGSIGRIGVVYIASRSRRPSHVHSRVATLTLSCIFYRRRIEFYPLSEGGRRLSAWHLPGGPVGPPARWAATSNVEGESATEEGAQGP